MATNTTPKKMQYVRLGNSGLKVSKIILGMMSYGSSEWQPWVIDNEETAMEHVKVAYDAGIQTFDTANVYSNGLSEVLMGKAIKKYNLPRDEIVIMTKVRFPVGDKPSTFTPALLAQADEHGFVNQYGLSRKHIFDSVKRSLARLQLDYIDVLQCHRFDPNTPISETMQALHDVVQAGYVRYVGMSSCWAYQLQAMQNYAIANKLTPFISMQNQYSLIYREEEREMMPTLEMMGVGSIPYSPLGKGLLTRSLSAQTKTKRGETDAGGFHKALTEEPAVLDVINRVEEIAKKKGASMAQISIAWCLSKPAVTAPIVGTTSLDNLRDIIGGAHIELTQGEIKYLEEPYKPRSILGHT